MRAYSIDGLEPRLCLASISGFVFNDINANGSREEGEAAHSATGITAYLDTNNNAQFDDGEINQQTYIRGGKFEFTQLEPGTYTVRLKLTDRFKQTAPANDAGRTVTITNEGFGTVDAFGVQSRARIAGTVYGDANHNGVLNSGENTLLSGQVVYLDTNNNAQFDDGEKSFITQVDGFWFDVDPGTYTLRLKTKPNWVQSQPAENGAFTVIVPETGIVNLPRYYFGTYEQEQPVGAVAGKVWNDVNGDGARQDGEPWVPNVRVYLDLNKDGKYQSETERSDLTDSAGEYEITGVTPGVYDVRQLIDGNWYQTFPVASAAHVANVAANQAITGLNFGRRSTTPGSIGGVVFNDLNNNGVRDDGEAGLANQIVYIDFNKNGQLDPVPASDTIIKTDANGKWSMPLTGGISYQFRLIVPAGFTQTSPGDGFYNVTAIAGQTIDGKNFGLHKKEEVALGKISGTFFIDLNGNATLDNTDTRLGSKQVYLDANNNNILDNNEKTVNTNAGGEYVFTGLVAGTYRVRAVIPNGYKQTTALANPVLVAGQIVGNINIGIKSNETVRVGTISGVAWADTNADGVRQNTESVQVGKTIFIDANKNGVLDLGEKSTQTNGEGRYTFANLVAGNYRIRRVLPAGYRLTTPASGYYDVALAAGQIVGEKNFGTTERALVSGRVFKDSNGDKKRNDGEAGLVGWVIYIDKNKNGKLDDGERKTTTVAGGEWAFRDLVAGTYRIRVQGKDGYKLTTPTAGYFDLTVTSGQKKTELLFGEKPI